MTCRTCGCGAVGADVEEEMDALVLDLEEGPCKGHTKASKPDAAVTEIARAGLMGGEAAHERGAEAGHERAAERVYRCIIRGLLALLWVFLADLFRRYVSTLCEEELIVTICPLSLLAIAVTLFFCTLVESLG